MRLEALDELKESASVRAPATTMDEPRRMLDLKMAKLEASVSKPAAPSEADSNAASAAPSTHTELSKATTTAP